MGAQAAEIRDAGANLAAVGLGSEHHAREFRDETGITFPLLVDADRVAYEAAGLRSAGLVDLVRPKSFRARSAAKKDGFDQHRLGEHPFQLGGSFVFAPPDRDVFTHVSETFSDNADPADLVAAVRRAA